MTDVSAPIGQPVTYLFGEFPGLGLALVPDVVVAEVEQGAHEAEISIQISALARVLTADLAV